MPSRTFFLALALIVGACVEPVRSGSLQSERVDDCVAVASLIEGINAFDPFAIRLALQSLHCFDGSEIEDLYRSLGVAFSKKPALVTKQILLLNIRTEYVVPVMTMLPLSYVDDVCGSVLELERRQSLILKSEMPIEMKEMLFSAVQHSLERDRTYCVQESHSG